jgi:Ca2+-binding EF-hand superfamily protein
MKTTTTGILAAFAFAAASVALAGGDKFQMMDTDKDGMISAEEHSAGAKQMFTKLDSDGDGNVTAAEMDAAHAGGKAGEHAGPKMSSAEKIRTIDGNNDGRITASEHESASRDKFAKMDANGDGKLSESEMQAGHTGMKGERTD